MGTIHPDAIPQQKKNDVTSVSIFIVPGDIEGLVLYISPLHRDAFGNRDSLFRITYTRTENYVRSCS